jgi:hypothetical protein
MDFLALFKWKFQKILIFTMEIIIKKRKHLNNGKNIIQHQETC